MPDRSGEHRRALRSGRFAPARANTVRIVPSAIALANVIWAGLCLAACSSFNDASFTVFVDPGKYQFHSCEQIAGEMKTWSRREQELKSLMDRADQSVGGTAVGLIAYKADYVAAGEELELLKSTARSKSCEQAGSWRSDAAIR
jgi:hypothetical protein